jgi:tyrosyl-tRNA synthetase
MPLAEIARLEALAGSELNEAKKILATEATALCHGRAAAEHAAATARSVFEEGGIGGALPIVELPCDALAKGIPAFEAFARAGLAASNGEARRLIKGGGGRLNDAVLANETQLISLADLSADGVIKLSAGRKRHALLKPV